MCYGSNISMSKVTLRERILAGDELRKWGHESITGQGVYAVAGIAFRSFSHRFDLESIGCSHKY